MQISAESVKFCFYTKHAPKSNRESELNLSFDENEKINFALRFLKYVAGFMQSQRQKRRYQICFLSIKFKRSLPLKVIKNVKRIRSLAK